MICKKPSVDGKASPRRFALFFLLIYSLVVGSVASDPVQSLPSQNHERLMLGVGVGFVRSSWKESVFSGSKEVRELGTFPSMDIRLYGSGLGGACDLNVGFAGGDRSYDGWSSRGAPVQTSSDVGMARIGAACWRDVGSLGALGLRTDVQAVSRRIGNAGAVKGYDERFVDVLALMGLRRQWRSDRDDLWKLEVWLGAGPPGRMRLVLPGYEAATLKLGSSRIMEAAIVWTSRPLGASQESPWRAQLAASYGWKRTAAGPQTPIQRNGRVAAQAAQPQTTQSAFGLQWGLVRSW